MVGLHIYNPGNGVGVKEHIFLLFCGLTVYYIFQTLEPPQYVFWYHNDKIISYDTSRTKVSFDSGTHTEVMKNYKLLKLCEFFGFCCGSNS